MNNMCSIVSSSVWLDCSNWSSVVLSACSAYSVGCPSGCLRVDFPLLPSPNVCFSFLYLLSTGLSALPGLSVGLSSHPSHIVACLLYLFQVWLAWVLASQRVCFLALQAPLLSRVHQAGWSQKIKLSWLGSSRRQSQNPRLAGLKFKKNFLNKFWLRLTTNWGLKAELGLGLRKSEHFSLTHLDQVASNWTLLSVFYKTYNYFT